LFNFSKKKKPEKAKEPELLTDYALRYTENEISVYSHVDGFTLKGKNGTQLYEYHEPYGGYDRFVWKTPEWVAQENRLNQRVRSYAHYKVVVIRDKAEAIVKAIREEMRLDASKAESERRKNFVSEKVWR
jgi:hypothetical protein